MATLAFKNAKKNRFLDVPLNFGIISKHFIERLLMSDIPFLGLF